MELARLQPAQISALSASVRVLKLPINPNWRARVQYDVRGAKESAQVQASLDLCFLQKVLQ